MILKALELVHMAKIVEERNKIPETLRTPFKLNSKMQEEYFINVICNRDSKTRYFAIYNDCGDLQPEKECMHFIGMGGIENIEWENGRAELSLLIFEEYRNRKYGSEAVSMILDNAFNYFGLSNIWLMCYDCNIVGVKFWNKILDKYSGFKTWLPAVKLFKGKYHGALYGNISKDKFNGI